MEGKKYIKMLKGTVLLCLALVFSSFSLVKHYDVLPKANLEQQTEKETPNEETSFEVSPYEAIVPVFYCQFEQATDYVASSEVLELITLSIFVTGIIERSDYQKILFRLIISPNAP